MTTLIYNHKPEAFKAHSQFKNLQEFNTATEKWLADHKSTFGRKELQALKTIMRHSVRVFGIATLKINKIVSVAAEKFGFTFNAKTAKRAIAKAKQIGMLVTLETKSAKTGLKAPSVYVWQKYKNVPTLVQREAMETGVVKRDNNAPEGLSTESSSSSFADSKMSPHKTGNKKINNLLNNKYVSCAKGFKSIVRKLTVKKSNNSVDQDIELLTNPSQPKQSKPLAFISRLKDVVYNSKFNNKQDADALANIVYGNVYSVTKFKTMQPHKEMLLERALRIVKLCLDMHKKGLLDFVRNMRGWIDSRIKDELQAFCETLALKTEPKPSVEVAKKIIDTYSNALEAKHVSINDAFDEWLKA